MDRRSWPWKKKSSVKSSTTTDSSGNQGDQDNAKNVNYVEISAESYAHLNELDDQMKVLNVKLSSAQLEMTDKDNLVKQHAKVAEEAVSGWEKAEAESLSLKQHLESVKLQKLIVENRASHLDDALKECMKQMANLKEECEKNLQDTIFTKTKQWEKERSELESKIVNFEQVLLRSSAECDSLSSSLEERTTLLMKISKEKSRSDADIENLKANIQSCDREINSLKYELHMVLKELEIRSEEKNMSIRSAEAASKQHIEDVRKIAKLEADCQRLRGLVRKKLPGTAALAQMRLEVESLGRDYCETRLQQFNAKSLNQYLGSTPKFTFQNIQPCAKENEFLTARLLAMEEETKMLKEALFESNNELQASRNMYAMTISNLQSAETHLLVSNQQKSPSNSNIDRYFDGSWSQNKSNPNLTSISDDGLDDEGSCSDSWATSLRPELSQFKKGKVENTKKAENSNHLESMDDFLEMEKLACLSTETNGMAVISYGVMDKIRIEISPGTPSVDVQMDVAKEWRDLGKPTNQVSCFEERTPGKFTLSKDNVKLSKLQSRIVSICESQVLTTDVAEVLEDVWRIMQDRHDDLPHHSGYAREEVPSVNATCEHNKNLQVIGEATNSGNSLKQYKMSCSETNQDIDGLRNAISQIHDFVLLLCKEYIDRSSDELGLREKFKEFSGFVDKIPHKEIKLDDYICALAHIFSETRKLGLDILSRVNEGEITGIDCIDKVTLLENGVDQHEAAKKRFSGDCTLLSPSGSDAEIYRGPTIPKFELKACSTKEFEQMKLEKDNMLIDLARCNESLQHTKLQLVGMEHHLTELKSQLDSCHQSNSLADTRLRCMTESYKSLELQKMELESDVDHLRSKAEVLDHELQEERRSHWEDLARYKNLQEKIERNAACSVCSCHSEVDIEKTKQERQFTAATEKLAECQESIFLLGRQLKALHPSTGPDSSSSAPRQMSKDCSEDEPCPNGYNSPLLGVHNSMQSGQTEQKVSSTGQTTGEIPLGGYNSISNPSDMLPNPIPRPQTSSKRQKHRSRSASSSSLASMLGEKQARSFSRFFFQMKE